MTNVVLYVFNSLGNNLGKVSLDFIVFILINNDLCATYVVVFIDQDNLSIIKSRLAMRGSLSVVKQEGIFVVDMGTERNADVIIIVSVYQEASVRSS